MSTFSSGMKLCATCALWGGERKRSGCDMGQGYLFSRPLPADQLIAFIRQHNS